MKKIYYDVGPQTMSIMELGRFSIGVPKEVSNDEIANLLVKRGQFKFWGEPTIEKKIVIEEPKKKNIGEV